MLNEEIVRAGLARATTFAGDESPQMTRIRKAQTEARAAQRGIWSKP
jgi:endonuclease YncB( thermonuclease family)